MHGLGFSPDRKTLAVVSIGSNSVSFIDTATNTVKQTTYVGRSPHEAFYTPDGTEVWVTVRGESYVSVIDAATFREKLRIETPNGPGMTIFSPDGAYAYVCSSFTPETVIIGVANHETVGKVEQASPFCPNIAVTPDGEQVWVTLKDVGKAMVFEARPPFKVLQTIEIGPITNHVNFARTPQGQLAYVTVGGTNEVQVFRTQDFSKVATTPVGRLPHGLWPSGDGTRMYVGLENDDSAWAGRSAPVRASRRREARGVGAADGRREEHAHVRASRRNARHRGLGRSRHGLQRGRGRHTRQLAPARRRGAPAVEGCERRLRRKRTASPHTFAHSMATDVRVRPVARSGRWRWKQHARHEHLHEELHEHPNHQRHGRDGE